jgi:hypothetical protein
LEIIRRAESALQPRRSVAVFFQIRPDRAGRLQRNRDAQERCFSFNRRDIALRHLRWNEKKFSASQIDIGAT